MSAMPSWTLHHGDCLDAMTGLASLADKSVDHALLDPPYEAEAHTNARRVGKGGRSGTAGSRDYVIDFGAIDEATRIATSRELVRVVRGWILAFCQVEAVAAWRSTLEVAGAKWARGMVWVKPCAAPQFTGDRPGMGHESIATGWAGGGRMKWNGGGKHGVYIIPISQDRVGDRFHPTQKPEALMEALVRDFTDPGDLILDPFAGSGTTGVAALRLGRRFVGWERDAKYHAIASKRLAATREQLGLFADGA